jgi:anti-sigma regulatory factor (Ser/Thr protein kinase)
MEVLTRNGGAARGAGREELLLRLPARPESLSVARRKVDELGRSLGLPQPRLDDLRTVVTEACANAVAHAYTEREGMLKLRAVPRRGELLISVSDTGDGIRPRPAADGASARLGLLLMAALASKVEISKRRNGGTRVRIRFPIPT